MRGEEWTRPEFAHSYLDRADEFPRRAEGEASFLEVVPRDARRVLDLGTGDARLLRLLRTDRPSMTGVGLDLSKPMLAAARARLDEDGGIELRRHDLSDPLPELGRFDVVVSSLCIHHLSHERKRSLYAEAFELLEPGGVFANLDHVASPTYRLHLDFYVALGEAIEDEDPSDNLLDVETQLGWLREIGFEDVDCHWKWRELALLAGTKHVDFESPRSTRL